MLNNTIWFIILGFSYVIYGYPNNPHWTQSLFAIFIGTIWVYLITRDKNEELEKQIHIFIEYNKEMQKKLDLLFHK